VKVELYSNQYAVSGVVFDTSGTDLLSWMTADRILDPGDWLDIRTAMQLVAGVGG
jgi:hypothetical protein